jgi:hypothetical protein
MQHHFPTVRDKARRLADTAQIALSSVQRAQKGQVGAGLDTIEAIARAFDLSAYQLLIPGLDPANPQSIPGALLAERRLYRQWQALKPATQEEEPPKKKHGKASAR